MAIPKLTTEETEALETTAFEYLTPKSRSIIFHALKSLSNEIQRWQDYSDMNPAAFQDVTNNTKDFHNNIKLYSQHLKTILQSCSKKGDLSLFQHFSD
jgi:hypothetical protein